MLPRSLLLRLTTPTTPRHDSHDVVDAHYWLLHSDGFRVRGPSGRVGTVMRAIDGTDTLIIRTGIFGSGRATVRFAQVDDIAPWDERLTIRRPARPATTRNAPSAPIHR